MSGDAPTVERMSSYYGVDDELPVTGGLVLLGGVAFITAGILTTAVLAGTYVLVEQALDTARRRKP